MTKNSFSFGTSNSVDTWGVHMIKHDTFAPPKRSRKITIPGRSGSYDFGASRFDERTLRLECSLERRMSAADFREIIFAFSRKNLIRLWDEPDKYYIGELYNADEVFVYQQEQMRDFELNFICEPFAYRVTAPLAIRSGVNRINYGGTAEAPTVIEIRNTNSYAVSNIVLIAIKRRS